MREIWERQDIQRLLRDQPDVLEDGLFIIDDEYSEWVLTGV